jgi:transposase
MVLMATEMRVITERVDDIPVLMAQLVKMNVPVLLDEYFPTHGNWNGTSLGWTASVWTAHMLSQGDHRLNQVETWVANRESLLGQLCGGAVQSGEWSDDRLGIVLDELSDDEKWQGFERALNQHVLRVYALETKWVRVDSTTTSGHWAVSEDSLFQYGHSKDHRPDLPQVKVMLSTLDPLGMPVATQVVSGEKADAPLYIPAIREVSAGLGVTGLLYVGDCKMAALETRAHVHSQGDYYLCPLSETQLSDELLDRYLSPYWDKQQALQAIYRVDSTGQEAHIAEGFELSIPLNATVNDQPVQWKERRLVVRSEEYRQSQFEQLHAQLNRAQTRLNQLTVRKQGKTSPATAADLHAAVQAILKVEHAQGLFTFHIEEEVTQRNVRAYNGHPAHTVTVSKATLHFERDAQAIHQAELRLGWRVYVTNHPLDTLPLDKAVLAYREQFLAERGFARLKGYPLSISPMYLHTDSRVTGLIRLLTIGLRLLTLFEHCVRKSLANQYETLVGLYAGNPKRATQHPTTEMMLQAFKYIDLSIVFIGDQRHLHLTELNEVQTKILSLLGGPTDLYTGLTGEFCYSSSKMTER